MNAGFGPYLRECREKSGLTLRAAAASAEISPSYLSRLETGDELRPPSEETLARICAAIDADINIALHLAGRVPSDVTRWLLSDRSRIARVRRMMKRTP